LQILKPHSREVVRLFCFTACQRSAQFPFMTPPVITPEIADPPSPPAKLNWFLFLLAIFLPTIATILAVQMKSKDLAPAFAVLGGGLSGIAGGILLALRFGRTSGSRLALGLGMAVVVGLACITMNCFGCLASGYKLDFK
jgi:hypothetical protein